MKPTYLLLSLMFLAAFTAIESAGGRGKLGPLVGGWSPIENISDPHVAEVGKFAVNQYNKQSKAELKFQRVVKGETQVVSGTNYKLVLEVDDKKGKKDYEAIVWEKPWMHYMNLTSFKPLN